jgi:hypothetical protein
MGETFQLRSIYRILSVLAAFGVIAFLTLRPGLEGDTQALVDGAFNGFQCMTQGQWIHCPREVGPFTVFQYIPSFILEFFGASKSVVMHVLVYLSMGTGLFCIWETFKLLRARNVTVAWFGLLVISSGYWLRYLNLSSGEMLASFFTFMFISSYLSGKSIWRTGFFLFATTLTKDIAFVFLIFWVLSLGVAHQSGHKPDHKPEHGKDTVKLLTAILLGVAGNSAFNLFRFGTLLTHGYEGPDMFIHDVSIQISYFFAQWISPAGGMIVFWPSFAVLLGMLLFFIVRVPNLRKIPGFVIFAILTGLSLGLSKWYSPLGGYCWGARFFLPWIPGLAFYALWSYSDEITALLKSWVARPVLFWVLAVGLAAATFPQYAFLLRQSLIGKVMDPPGCVQLAGTAHENCRFWPAWPWGIFEFYSPLPRLDLFALAAFMSSWVVVICLKMRSLLVRGIS